MKTTIFAMSFCIVSSMFAPEAFAGDFKIKIYETMMPLAEYAHKAQCNQTPDNIICLDSRPWDTVGGYPLLQSVLIFNKEDSKMDAAVLTYESNNYSEIKRAIEGKYGKLKCSSSPVSTAGGGLLENELCSSTGKTGDTLKLKKYHETATEGSVSIFSKRYEEIAKKQMSVKGKDI